MKPTIKKHHSEPASDLAQRSKAKPSSAAVKELLRGMDRKLDRAEARIDRVLEEQARRRA